MPWYRSIRWKLAFSYVALSFVLLLTFYFIVMGAIERYHINARANEVEEQAIIMANYVAGMHGFNNLDHATSRNLLQGSVNQRSNALGIRILVINDYAQVLADSNLNRSRNGQTLIRPEVISAINGTDTFHLDDDAYVLNVAVSVRDMGSGRIGAVLFVAPVDDVFRSIEEMRNDLLLSTLLVGILSIVLVFIQSHYLIAPLKRTVGVVRRMSTGLLTLRIPVRGKDEYAILAKAFNSLTEKLEQVEKTREEFVSNVSHELKTPLSAVKVLSESILLQDTAPEEMYREFLQDINSEVDRMTNITNDLLALVKVDQGNQGLNREILDLNQLVEDIMRRLSPLAEQRNIALIYEAERDVEMNADEIKLTLAISNIVENGIKYTPLGGTVKVNLNADYQSATITIQDTGIGIPEEEQDKIFNRFYRVDKTRDRETGGTGLGLAISRATVLLHNGSIQIRSKPDEGSVFTIRLPLGM